MTMVISRSELILVFVLSVKQRIEGYERREKEGEKEVCGLRCDVLSCAVL